MTLRIIGAGLPRTGTSSLTRALEHLLDGRCYHMSQIPGHPFDLGEGWQTAFNSGTPDWDAIFENYNAAVDWPASAFWHELSVAYPDALVILSTRDHAETWLQSVEATILPVARMALTPDWDSEHDLVTLFERFAGTDQWDDRATLLAAYERHNATVRSTAPGDHLLEWNARQGWEPLCQALDLPVPDMPFPHLNRREDWG